MRVIGPSKEFVHQKREKVDSVDVYGQSYKFTTGETFRGVITNEPPKSDAERMYEGKVGVQIDYKMRTMFTDLTEADRVKLVGTDRVFEIVSIVDLFEQGVYKVVDLHERKE
jgi:hypothetical protein